VGDPNMTTQITVRPLISTVVAVEERVILQGCASGRRQEWRGRKTKTDGVRCQKPAMAAETETVIKKSKRKQECCRTVVRHPICNDNFITVEIGMKVVRALV